MPTLGRMIYEPEVQKTRVEKIESDAQSQGMGSRRASNASVKRKPLPDRIRRPSDAQAPSLPYNLQRSYSEASTVLPAGFAVEAPGDAPPSALTIRVPPRHSPTPIAELEDNERSTAENDLDDPFLIPELDDHRRPSIASVASQSSDTSQSAAPERLSLNTVTLLSYFPSTPRLSRANSTTTIRTIPHMPDTPVSPKTIFAHAPTHAPDSPPPVPPKPANYSIADGLPTPPLSAGSARSLSGSSRKSSMRHARRSRALQPAADVEQVDVTALPPMPAMPARPGMSGRANTVSGGGRAGGSAHDRGRFISLSANEFGSLDGALAPATGIGKPWQQKQQGSGEMVQIYLAA